ncbi:hypothetical protein I4U23_019699 [Adineta vaga]|nr:hypothetical protein I4U23_019699 [Adineta vaga]
MKNVLLPLLLGLLILVTESSRHRRQYGGYGYAQQYGSQYGLYGPGGQGWTNNNNNNNMNNRYPNQQGYGWNSNNNWNQGNRRPEWYYNTANTIQYSKSMKGVINLTRWILSICLLIASLVHVDLFSIIYTLLFLAIPWAIICSTFIRLRFFLILSLIALMTSSVFLLLISSLHIFTKTTKGKDVFSISLITLINYKRASSENIHFHKYSISSENTIDHRSNHIAFSTHFQSIPIRIRPIFIYIRSMVLLVLIHCCGCLIPSILSAIYFLVSLGLTFWWTLGKHFGQTYLYIIRSLQIYSLIHLLLIYIYQLPVIQQYLLKPNAQLVRLLGLQILYPSFCFEQSSVLNHHWIVYLHPCMLLIFYWISIYEYHFSRKYHERLKILHRTQNNSENCSATKQHDSFHLQSLTDLFWMSSSNDTASKTHEKVFYKTSSVFIALISYVLSKAYMLSIISMLLWSITYHSYVTFPFLILSCFIWLLPQTKYWCHLFSPVFCLYAYILLLLNYIQSLNLLQEEFSWYLHEIEFLHSNNKSSNHITIIVLLECSIKFIYTLLLLLSLRQRTKDISYKQHQKNSSTSSSSLNLYEHIQLISPVHPETQLQKDSSMSRLNRMYNYFQSQYLLISYEIHYIIYTGYVHIWFYKLFFNWSRSLTITLIFVLSYNFDTSPVAYRIIYMAFFLQYHLCYSLSRRLWNIYLFPFYITIIIYSMIVLFAIYIYQFEEVQTFKTKICFAHIPCEFFFSSLGIRHAYKNILGKELFTPTVSIICIVMHIHFFHRHQRKFENLNSLKENQQHSTIRILSIIQWLQIRYNKFQAILWCLCELHIYKIVLIVICMCLTRQANICIINLILVVIFVMSLYFSVLQTIVLGIYALISALQILMIMIVRLELFASLGYIKNVCFQLSSNSTKRGYLSDINPSLSLRLIAPLEWFGLWTKSTSNITVGELIRPYLIVVLSIAVLQLVRRHCLSSLSLNELLNCTKIQLFSNINIQSMNDSLSNNLKYLCNYGSYRFGLELSLFASLCLILLRMDAIALLHAFIVLIFILLPRHQVRRFWKLYRILASISTIWLYLNALGLPSVLCLRHVFDHFGSIWFPGRLWPQMKIYFHLANYFEWQPIAEYLFPDFVLLIILTIQEKNFILEQQQTNVMEMGSNDYDEVTQSYYPNLLHDFITTATLSWSNRFVSQAFYCHSDYNQLVFDAFGFLFVLLFIRILSSYSFFYVRLELQVQEELSQMGASLLSQLNWLKLVEYRQRTMKELESIKARVTKLRQRRIIEKREIDIDEPIYHNSAILSGDYYMFDYLFDTQESSDTILQSMIHTTESEHSIRLFDLFEGKVHNQVNDLEIDLKSLSMNNNTYEWNHFQWDNKFIDSETFQQLSNRTTTTYNESERQSSINNPETSIGIDLSSFMTFFSLKQNFIKIRRVLNTMNSRLLIYLGHQIRTLLITRQVISDAKLCLKYPHESTRYNITFISSLSNKLYIRHSLIGHLHILANVLLLGTLSFHRIVLHQLGLWDDFHPPIEDSLIYQTNFIPSDIKLVRNQIIRGIYTVLKNGTKYRKKIETSNSNAVDEVTLQAPSLTSLLPNEVVTRLKSEAHLSKTHFHQKISLSIGTCIENFKRFIQTIRHFYDFAIACPIVPKVDYYSSIFLCDFIVIFLIIAGHQRFSHSESVEDNIIYRYIQGSSSLDITPILMLLTQFLLIIVDRIIYLKKNVHAKFLFLCFQFLVLHIWLVIVYPIWFQREMSKNWAAISIYIFKSIYFMLSALQIRNGYPTRILGNFLTTHYSILRLLCYKLYCTIPFLYEMRVLMDWMFIPTSLSLTYYFMMEEIARNAWTQKCLQMMDERSPRKRALNRNRCELYCIGGWILFAIIFVIWFPLIFFSISARFADPIPIDRCEIKVRLSTYKELYQLVTTNVRQSTEYEFSKDIYPLIMNSSFASGPRDLTESDVACISALGHVGAQWTISLSALNQLKIELKQFTDNTTYNIPQIYFDYSFIRKEQTSEQDDLPSGYIVTLSSTHNVSLTKENALTLLTMLSFDNQTQATIIVSQLMPKFIHLLPDMIDIKSPTYPQDIQLTLRRERQLLWWDISEISTNNWKTKCSFDTQALNFIVISERSGAQSKSFNLIAKLLIGSNAKLTLIGVYAGLVYVLWLTCFRQTLFSDIQSIMYHEWPFADRIQRLCEEVYLVRELGELQLEEELFARLLFLHRSPETLIRFTRSKETARKQEQYRNQHLHQH